ncbi:MAG: hypothetical protein HY433_03560 [Candidatus Liptonbacteria bacterium]|nr:hypothetical protein [Candidatus Liptonbacteria bacterium]
MRLEIIKETFADYSKRYWKFWAVLYVFTVLAEVMREIYLERVAIYLSGITYNPVILFNLLIREMLASPVVFLAVAGGVLFNLWGFASLYFLFSGASFIKSASEGLKHILSYFGLVVAGGIIVFAGFLVLAMPILLLLNAFLGDSLNPNVAMAIFLAFGIPGWWLLVSFSVAPFILLLEKRKIFNALRESYRRVSFALWQTIQTLIVAFVMSAAAYYALSWIIFSLKLIFIQDLSFRGETSLRIFVYSIPWVVVASFFDLAVYRIYLRLKPLSDSLPSENEAIRKDFLG